MRITPLDVRKQDFRKAVRGFDCDEVRAFLSTLADEYETVLVDNKQLRDSIMNQDDKLSEYRTMENTLRDTLMTAERMVQESRENAAREGDLIVREAHLKARQVLEECRVRTEELRREIAGLRQEKQAYLGRYRALAQAQIQFVDAHQADFEVVDRRLLEIVDSVLGGLPQSTAPTVPTTQAAPASSVAPAAPAAAAMAPTAPAPWAAAPATPATPVARGWTPPGVPAAAQTPWAPPTAQDPWTPPVPSVAPTAIPIPRPSAQPEVDRWRDYQPVAPAHHGPVSPLTVVPPAAMPPAADPAEEILATIANLEPVDGEATPRRQTGNPYEVAAEAELATLGIRVPPVAAPRSQEPAVTAPV